MFETRISLTLSIALLLVASLCGACSKSAPAETSNANPSVSPSPQNSGIEVEIVTAKPIEWAITASGKILVTEDRVATIGPIHEGRIVKLFRWTGQRRAQRAKVGEPCISGYR
jgi:hypothetical protein